MTLGPLNADVEEAVFLDVIYKVEKMPAQRQETELARWSVKARDHTICRR